MIGVIESILCILLINQYVYMKKEDDFDFDSEKQKYLLKGMILAGIIVRAVILSKYPLISVRIIVDSIWLLGISIVYVKKNSCLIRIVVMYALSFTISFSVMKIMAGIVYFEADVLFVNVAITVNMYFLLCLVKVMIYFDENFKVAIRAILMNFIVCVVMICIEGVLLREIMDRSIIDYIFLGLGTVMLFIVMLLDNINDLILCRASRQINSIERDYFYNESRNIKNKYDELRLFRHDFKNKLIAINEYISSERYDDLKVYISQLTDKLDNKLRFVDTGNIIVDGIINNKLNYASMLGITVSTRMSIPTEMNIIEDDMVIILGNILDNAIEACQKVENGRIHITGNYDRSVINIDITNSYNGEINKSDDVFVTSKDNKEEHGLGLLSVKSTIEKYNGVVEFNYDDRNFTTSCIFYEK